MKFDPREVEKAYRVDRDRVNVSKTPGIQDFLKLKWMKLYISHLLSITYRIVQVVIVIMIMLMK